MFEFMDVVDLFRCDSEMVFLKKIKLAIIYFNMCQELPIFALLEIICPWSQQCKECHNRNIIIFGNCSVS